MIILSMAVCFYLLFFVFKDKARVGVETLAARKLQQSAQAFILQLWTEVKYLSIYVLIASFPLFAWNSSVQWTIDPETSTKKAKLEIIHWQGFVEFFSFFFELLFFCWGYLALHMFWFLSRIMAIFYRSWRFWYCFMLASVGDSKLMNYCFTAYLDRLILGG